MRLILLLSLILFASLSYGQNVGVGTASPGTKLDVNGALTLRETQVAVTSNAATIPSNVSQVRLTGTATATITLTAPAAPANAGEWIVIYNNTTGGYGATFAGTTIPDGVAIHFIYTNSTWVATVPSSTSVSADNGLNINTGTNVELGGTLTKPTTIGQAGNTLSIGNDAAANTLVLGSTNTSSSTTIQSGTGNMILNPSTGAVVVGSGDASGAPAGAIVRGPSAGSGNTGGGTLTIQGGTGSGTGMGGNVAINGGTSASGTRGSVVIGAANTGLISLSAPETDLGVSSGTSGLLTMRNASNNNTVNLTTGATSSSYFLSLPTAIGGVGQALSISSVSLSTATMGWVTPLTAATGVTSITSASPLTANTAATGAVTVNLTGIVPVANGGTGSSTQNWVDLTTTQTAAGAKTWSNNATFNGGTTSLGNATSNTIAFGTAGVAGPSFTTSSAGSKIIFYPQESASTVDYAVGITGNTLWHSVPQATSTYLHSWYAGTTELMRIQGNGYLGVGTTSPGAPVDVTNTATIGLRYTKTGASDARLTVGDNSGQYWSWSTGWGASNGGAAGDFSLIQEGTSGNRIYVQKATGFVGLGTVTPQVGLEVDGALSATYAKFGATAPVYIVANSPMIGFNTYWNGGYLYGTSTYGGMINFNQELTGGFNILTAGSGTGGASAGLTSRMSITNGGYVGIGTTSPTSALDVRGNINLNGNTFYISGNNDNNHHIIYNSTYDGPQITGCSGLDIYAQCYGNLCAFHHSNAYGGEIGYLSYYENYSSASGYYYYDVMNDLNALDAIKPQMVTHRVTGAQMVGTRPESLPEGFTIKSSDSLREDMACAQKMLGLALGGVRQLRAETKTHDQAQDERIARLEGLVAQMSGRALGEIEFTGTSTAYKGLESYYIVDARIKPTSQITISGLSGYEIIRQDEGGFGIRFSSPPSADTHFTYSSKY